MTLSMSAEERSAQLQRWVDRLQSLPSIALPTDYPRPATSQVVQALSSMHLSAKARTALVRLAVHHDIDAGGDGEDEEEEEEDGAEDGFDAQRGKNKNDGASHTKALRGDRGAPSPFHLLLAAFVVILHRYTGDTDIVIGSSSPLTGEPMVLRIPIEPVDPFWQIVRRIQQVEREAAEDCAPYDEIQERLEAGRDPATSSAASAPIFRVRFFDESGPRQRSFLQSTSLTTDLTIFIERPGAPVAGQEDLSASTSTITGSSGAASASSTTNAPSRGSIVPDLSLKVSYNALLFSQARTRLLLSHIARVVTAASVNPSALVGTIGLRTPVENTALPDPRKDLDFCGFRGSITSIFEQNAKRHPDRRCLIESLEPEDRNAITLPQPASRTREVTYRQLDEASNIVAHHLLQAGVQREEVVTVYAHRGVDLVVAVLGTLKAGATFSVIDPAYPPTRQTIYLQVAKPRALIVLAKAGKLHPTVRKCLEDELEIRTEVPALELRDDGILAGGNVDGQEIFLQAYPKAQQSTDVLLGPDSVATLSFTSGSTGIPKGVRGRHHSLTHFFPWMGQRFELGEHSRFTMLSGIAHDPIQRDIFTPIFFGAELHIPTADDIGTPGRLAEWMAASRATVTHLTPAMGQLLSAQATAKIPDLRNAFFVGDILTKRDCTRLQALAANVRIINMYGTTETQRAVSYFEIPAVSDKPSFLATQKDVMPAGQGMIDVQLLVVNRNERTATCAVGEVGEIYVRSGGLSEGYLGPPEVTAEKFVANFLASDAVFTDTLKDSPAGMYWKGVRDRMYRTGDLGRYLPDGTVECTGRADDQVKIRGFRIELGEIDLHLSRHPHVRENVTLVRRDKDEEKVLVSYFVPGPGASSLQEASGSETEGSKESGQASSKDLVRGMRRHRRLIKDIREHLKKKLPAYSVPTLFVPLGKMPLNPNGKVDKPALPFPDTALANAALSSGVQTSTSTSNGASSARGYSPTEETVARLFGELLPSCPRPVPVDESFFDLGGHSILATRLVFSMRKAFIVNVPLGAVFDSPTVAGLGAHVDKLRQADLHIDTAADNTGSSEVSANGKTSHPLASHYHRDIDTLAASLPDAFVSGSAIAAKGQTVLLTGATGFLGIYLLRDLLTKRTQYVGKVIVHVRAKDREGALERVRQVGIARSCWDEAWVQQGRLDVVVGDLAADRLGLDRATWSRLAQEVDAVIHNGALVHWVYHYDKLRAPNVLSTLACIMFCASGKPKSLTFVSSTSAIDTSHYVQLSDSILQSSEQSQNGRNDAPLTGVPETDDLSGSASGLSVGYGQSKYVSERLVMLAASRGLRASIVRPGYVLGDTETATTNTDDFLWRLVKSGTQIGLVPDIHNTVNMTPVDHVARITALASLATAEAKRPTKGTAACVYHVTGHPTSRYSELLGSLELYGWPVKSIDYVLWRTELQEHVLRTSDSSGAATPANGLATTQEQAEEENALFPLLHFVMEDLPTSTKSPELDDRHTQALLQRFGEHMAIMGVDMALMGHYLAWLVAVGFLKPPTRAPGEPLENGAFVLALPEVSATKANAIGRGSAA